MYIIKYHNLALMDEILENTFDSEEKLKSFICWLITTHPIENVVVIEVSKG